MMRLTAALAACVCVCLPFAAYAGEHAGNSTYWKSAPNGQGVVRVYGGGDYAPPPPAYHGGNFHGGLNVETRGDYRDDYAPVAAYDRSQDCRTVCVSVAPPPPPPVSACHKVYRDERVVEYRQDYAYEQREYPRSHARTEHYERYEGGYAEPRVYHETRYDPHARYDDCPCRNGHDHARYDDRDAYHDDDRYADRREGPYDRYADDGYRGRDVFGRY